MNTPPEMLATLGVIGAAIFGGLVSFIVSVLSKDQKTSEFRQAWIDALRTDISEYVSRNLAFVDAVKIQGARPNADAELGEYILSERFQDMLDIEATRARILLRLNPTEHSKLVTLVNNVYGRTGVAAVDEFASLAERIEALVGETQKVLKREWRRVKTGEPVFFMTKWVSLALAVTALSIGTAFFTGHWHVSYAP
jgi:hypothetical protein